MQYLKRNIAIISIVLIFLLLNNLSYIAGFIYAHQNHLFYTGLSPVNAGDYLVYISNIEQGRQGHIFLQNLFDTQSQHGTLFSPHWYIMGQAGRWLNLSNVSIYHIFRIIFSLIFISTLWWWIKKIFISQKSRCLALAFVLFSSNFIYLFSPIMYKLNIGPSSLWIFESNTFTNMFCGPHFILSQSILLLIFALFIKNLQKTSIKKIIYLHLLFALLIFMHPYDGVIVLFVCSILTLSKYLENKNINYFYHLASLFVSLGILGLYYLWALQDPGLYAHHLQNITKSPNFWSYFFGFGWLLIIGLLGSIYIIQKTSNEYLKLLAYWALAGLIMVYLPINFNRRLANGWHIALSMITIYCLIIIYQKIQWSKKFVVLPILFMIFSFDTLVVSINNDRIEKNIRHIINWSPNFIKNYDLVKNNSIATDNILAPASDGSILAAFAGRKIYAGHEMQTGHFLEKQKIAKAVLTSKKNILPWLKENNIQYIFATRYNASYFSELTWLQDEKYLEPIVQNNNAVFYRVKF